MRSALSTAGIAVLAILVTDAPAQAETTAPRRAVDRLYAERCAACHGGNLEGGQGPSLLDAQWVHGDDDESVAESIRTGYPANGMPGWVGVLSEAEIRSLVIYLRERRVNFRGDLNWRQRIITREQPTGVLDSELHRFWLETMAEGLDTPWAIAFLPDGRALVTEKPGRLRVMEHSRLLAAPVKGIPHTREFGQGGLLDVAPHPEYARNGWIYLSYSDIARNAQGQEVASTVVVRGRIRQGQWVDQQTIWRAPAQFYLTGGGHFGSRIAFDGRGYLYFTHGERLVKEDAQDLTRPNGKIHRLHDDGRIPADNPFVHKDGAFPSIWSYGHRNPQGLTFDAGTRLLWATEHGPRGGDELNLIRPGRNYGWPVITYGMNYDGTPIAEQTAREGLEQPVTHWTPSIAVSGIEFYDGSAFPKWRHDLLVTALAGQELRRLVIEGERVKHQEILVKDIGRLRDIAQGSDGHIYIVVNPLNASGRIVRLVPAP